jgi:hypothetical protein
MTTIQSSFSNIQNFIIIKLTLRLIVTKECKMKIKIYEFTFTECAWIIQFMIDMYDLKSYFKNMLSNLYIIFPVENLAMHLI